jgi:signal transduction histidine kinase
MGVGLTLNGVLWLMTTRKSASVHYYHAVAIIQVVLDLVLASAVIYAGGGAESRAIALYAMPIIVAGVLYPHPGAYLAAVLSGVSYIAVIVSYPLIQHSTDNLRLMFSPGIFYPLFFLMLAAILTRFSALNAVDEQENGYRQVLAMLHHQMLHPSSVIAAIAEMLETSDGYDKWSAKDKSYLQQLKRENLRLNSMITNVLESAREPKENSLSHTKPVDLLTLLNEVSTNCAIAARRMTDLQTNLPHENITLHAQPQQLHTAFENIIANAFTYSEEGTPVSISLDYDKEAGHITIRVQDKGKGMSGSDQKRLFHLFTRLEERGGRHDDNSEQLYSLGLGLYVSKVILERHGGWLELESKEGVGTTVTIKIQEDLWRRPEFFT